MEKTNIKMKKLAAIKYLIAGLRIEQH